MSILENRPLLFGIGMLVLGGLITAGTYAAASDGGSYVIATGLLAVGGLNLIRGLYYQAKYGTHRDESLYRKSLIAKRVGNDNDATGGGPSR